MIKKLQKKFVLINMLLVSAVLIAVVAASCISAYRSTVGESIRALEHAWNAPQRLEFSPRPDENRRFDGGFSFLPVFSVTLGENDVIESVNAPNVDVSEEFLQQAVAQAIASQRPTGVLRSLDLRYLVDIGPAGSRIAFVDLERERQALSKQLMTALIVIAGGLTAFFAVSVFLSRWALRPVERAWEQQRRFVADASHELKTPLTVILANTGILLKHCDSTIGEQQKWVDNTQAEAQRMKKLVDDLLFLAKSDAVSDVKKHLPLDFSDLVWSGELPFESVAFEQGVTLETEIEPDIGVVGDEGQLRQLVAILLDNACKYSGEHGRVRLVLESAGDRARLSVSNTGEGLDEQALKHVFERFYRADASRARTQGGYGLGLSIAQTVVQSHGGSITAQSRSGGETTFTVLLPKMKAEDKNYREVPK